MGQRVAANVNKYEHSGTFVAGTRLKQAFRGDGHPSIPVIQRHAHA